MLAEWRARGAAPIVTRVAPRGAVGCNALFDGIRDCSFMLCVSGEDGARSYVTASDRNLLPVALSHRIQTNGMSHSIFSIGASASNEVPW